MFKDWFDSYVRRGIDSCFWCRIKLTAETATHEHLQSQAFGGTWKPGNLVVACEPCNNQRSKVTWLAKQGLLLKNKEGWRRHHAWLNQVKQLRWLIRRWDELAQAREVPAALVEIHLIDELVEVFKRRVREAN